MASSSLSRKVIDRVRQTIREHAMIAPGDRILVGFSGGPDSVALARILMALAAEFDLTLELAHLNHSLRGEDALRDETFAKTFAAAHGLRLTVETSDIKDKARTERLSLEEAGRNARYAFFRQTADTRGCNRIATGHHRDDHVEQMLMNLIRGCGIQGLTGIAPVRDNRIIRPLIALPKEEILAYLNDIGQDYMIDASNRDTAFLRNRIRHTLIPLLASEFNPDIASGLARLSRIVAQEDDYMRSQTREMFDRLSEKTAEPGEEAVFLNIPGLIACPSALARRVLRQAILIIKQDLKRISHTHILDIMNLAENGETGKHLDLPGQIRVYRMKTCLKIKREPVPLRDLGRAEKKKHNS